MHLGLAINIQNTRISGGPVSLPGAPVFEVWPAFTPSTGVLAGDVVALSVGTVAGDPVPDVGFTLHLDGADVTADVSDGVYRADGPGALLLTVTAQNAIASRIAIARMQIEQPDAYWDISSAGTAISVTRALGAPTSPAVTASGLDIFIGALA